jgi:hypothetical protein
MPPIGRHHRAPTAKVLVSAISLSCPIGRPWSSDTYDKPLTCGYAIRQSPAQHVSAGQDHGGSSRVQGCGTVTAIVNRTRLANLRDLHRREVACERHWRIRRGMTPVSGVAYAANRPTAATPSTPANPTHGRPCKKQRQGSAEAVSEGDDRRQRGQCAHSSSRRGYGRAAFIGRGTAQSRDDLFGEPLEGRTVFRYHDWPVKYRR